MVHYMKWANGGYSKNYWVFVAKRTKFQKVAGIINILLSTQQQTYAYLAVESFLTIAKITNSIIVQI